MSDVVVTVPMGIWEEWLDEGDLPGDEPTGETRSFYCGGAVPGIPLGPGKYQRQVIGPVRCYIVAHGKLRGYSPLVSIVCDAGGLRGFFREATAVACTIPDPIRGFRGWRYRWWDRAEEIDFPDWMTPGRPRRFVTGHNNRRRHGR